MAPRFYCPQWRHKIRGWIDLPRFANADEMQAIRDVGDYREETGNNTLLVRVVRKHKNWRPVPMSQENPSATESVGGRYGRERMFIYDSTREASAEKAALDLIAAELADNRPRPADDPRYSGLPREIPAWRIASRAEMRANQLAREEETKHAITAEMLRVRSRLTIYSICEDERIPPIKGEALTDAANILMRNIIDELVTKRRYYAVGDVYYPQPL